MVLCAVCTSNLGTSNLCSSLRHWALWILGILILSTFENAKILSSRFLSIFYCSKLLQIFLKVYCTCTSLCEVCECMLVVYSTVQYMYCTVLHTITVKPVQKFFVQFRHDFHCTVYEYICCKLIDFLRQCKIWCTIDRFH